MPQFRRAMLRRATFCRFVRLLPPLALFLLSASCNGFFVSESSIQSVAITPTAVLLKGGLTPADSGRIRFAARDLPLRLERRNKPMLRELQMVFQNPDMSLNPRHTIRTILVRPLRLLGGLGRKEAEAAARDLMQAVNLDARFLDRYPSQLSGGEKQRVAIARAFAARTKLVICDEPVSGLDVSVQATVLNLLQDLQRRWGTAYLFISHDLQVVQYLADRVLVLYMGHIVETGTTEQVFSGPNHPYTELLLSAIPRPDPDRPGNRLALESETKTESSDPRGCPFKGRCHRHIGPICDLEFPPLRVIGPGHASLCHLPVEDLPAGAGGIDASGFDQAGA